MATQMDDQFFKSFQPKDAEGTKYEQVTEKQRLDLNVRLICHNCRDPVPNIIEDFKQGDLICGSCGTVFKDRIIDTRSEWRTFSSDEGGDDPSRVGAAENPLLSNLHQLETTISMRDGGRGISKELLKTHHKNMSLRNDRILLQGFKDIASLGERMGLQKNVVEAGKQYFKLTEEKHMVRNRPDVVAAVCLLLGCRKTGNGRTLQEFADLVNTSKHDFGKIFIAINKEIANLTNVNSEDISGRYCNALGLSHSVSAMVAMVCTHARSISELASRAPATIAGASIYLVSHLMSEPRHPKDIALMVKITETTVRQAYRILLTHLDRIVDHELLQKRDLLPPA